jgi:YspA, cpYpsA-related SLOG family
MRVIVTGSMTWTDAEAIRRELIQLPAGTVVIHGDTAGVDALARQIAGELGLLVESFAKSREDYRSHGRGAWKRLNERMLESGADLVLAFHPELGVAGKARGSGHMVQIAEERGVQVRGFRA